MSIAGLILMTLVSADTPATAVVVATESDTALQERMLRVKDWSTATSFTVLETSEVQRRLSGLQAPQQPDVAELKKRIADAADREARFDSVGALAMRREVLRAYDNAVIPNVDLQVLAARALHDIAAGELAEGHTAEAHEAARTAQRRFPNVPLDTQRHPPPVEALFKRVALDVKRLPSTEVTIVSSKPGRVMADNVVVGSINQKMTRKLTQGIWLIWISDESGTSLAHTVTVASTPVTVDIDFALESTLSFTPVPTLRCAPACETALRQLATRARTDSAIGLALEDAAEPATGTFVRAEDGTVESRPLPALADLRMPPGYLSANTTGPAGPDRFSAWSLVPFGVGQFAQRRYLAGGIYAGIQTGLLAWNIAAAGSAGEEGSSDENSRRRQQNLAAGLLIGAMIANIAEAIVVDAMSD